MISKLFNTAAVVSLATLIAGGGFAGYLFATGKLDAQRLELIADVIRGKLDAPPGPPSNGEPSSADAAGGPEAAEQPTRPSAEEAQARRQREDMASLRLERAQADLLAQRRMLEQVVQHVVHEQEKLATDRKAFELEKKERDEALVDVGFERELELLSGLKSSQAKEHIIESWKTRKADAVRLMMKLEPRKARRILDQMRSPEEQQIMSDLLEEIRLQGTEDDAGPSGTIEAASRP
jgi:hypothetical protein